MIKILKTIAYLIILLRSHVDKVIYLKSYV